MASEKAINPTTQANRFDRNLSWAVSKVGCMLISSLFLWGVGHGCLWTFLGLSGRLPVMDQLCDFASILHQNVADWRIWGCEMWLMYAYGANWKLAHGPSGWVTLWKLLLVSESLDPPKFWTESVLPKELPFIYGSICSFISPFVIIYHNLCAMKIGWCGMTRRPMVTMVLQVADAALYPVLFRQYLEDGSGFTKDLLGFWRCIGSLTTKT